MKLSKASSADIELVISFIYTMLAEMTVFEGEPLNEADQVLAQLRTRYIKLLPDEDCICILAGSEEGNNPPAGLIEASIRYSENVYQPTKRLFIHALYVLPAHRNAGIGEHLIRAVSDWGFKKGCREVDLNVLANNPAIMLYEKMGFSTFKLNLRKTLSSPND